MAVYVTFVTKFHKIRFWFQALEQCGLILNKLGVTRINAVDTAVAAQVTFP